MKKAYDSFAWGVGTVVIFGLLLVGIGWPIYTIWQNDEMREGAIMIAITTVCVALLYALVAKVFHSNKEG